MPDAYTAKLREKITREEQEKAKKVTEIVAIDARISILRELLNEESSPELIKTEPTYAPDRTPSVHGRYAGFSLTPAILDALRHYAEKGATATELREFMIKEGFVSRGEHLHNSIHTSLKRLEDARKIKKVASPEGRPLYVLEFAAKAA